MDEMNGDGKVVEEGEEGEEGEERSHCFIVNDRKFVAATTQTRQKTVNNTHWGISSHNLSLVLQYSYKLDFAVSNLSTSGLFAPG